MAVAHCDGRVSAALAWACVLGLTVSTKYTAAALLVPRPGRGAGSARSRSATRPRLALVRRGRRLAAGLGAPGRRPTPLWPRRLRLATRGCCTPTARADSCAGLGRAALAAGTLALASRGLLGPGGRPGPARLRAARGGQVAAAAAAGRFLIGTPYAALRPLAFLSDLAYNHQTRFEYKGLTGAATSFGPYLRLLADALTGPLLAAAARRPLVAAAAPCARPRGRWWPWPPSRPYLLVAARATRRCASWRRSAPRPRGWPPSRSRPGPGAATRRATAPRAARARPSGPCSCATVLRGLAPRGRALARGERARRARRGPHRQPPGYAPTRPSGPHAARRAHAVARDGARATGSRRRRARYPAEASPWLVLTASFYERFLDHPEQQPERAAFFRDLLEGRGGFEVVARFRQEGWLRPAAEFLDPEIVVLRKTAREP